MTGERVFVRADEAREQRARARLRAREALRAFEAAEEEYRAAFAELDEVVGPDPRAVVAESAIAQFCSTITGHPSIVSA